MNTYFLDSNIDLKLQNKLNNFIDKNCINQQSYKAHNIYNEMDKFSYKYIVCENDLGEVVGVMPFIIYDGKYGSVIHSMPFIGYGCICSLDNQKEEIVDQIICLLEKFAKDENVLLITMCIPPFQQSLCNLIKDKIKPEFEMKNFFQYMDLKQDVFGNMKAKFRGNLRRNIKKCTRYGVELFESYSEEDLKYWYENVYLKRLMETGCSIYPYSVFKTFIQEFSKDRVKMVYAKLQDKIIAGGMYFSQGISLDNFMRVVDSEYFYTQVGTYLDYYSVMYAIENNLQYYNWESCDDIGSSIYKYKEDWGSTLDFHYYLTKVVGDISNITQVPLEDIKKEYKGIYVLPYDQFKKR
ncbi:hypothetical protein CBC_A0399 [Clostridium botulinum C str. Eklund]|nr:hypothetical protein CBC_A0399 [Clostridium botulinum C str. Eklund]NEZ48439.1 GNAT family N-acetyltransferase [Clostridium botulinum]